MTEINLLKVDFGEIYYLNTALNSLSYVCDNKDSAHQIKTAFRTEWF